MNIFPNPVSGMAVIQIENAGIKYHNLQFKMVDLVGLVVLQFEIKNQQTAINSAGLQGGVYHYEISDHRSFINSGKMVISH